MECRFCKQYVHEADKFCSACGRLQNDGAPPSDFEIGKVAALDSIKKDVLTWLTGGVGVVLLLAGVGVNQLITSRVNAAVDERLSRIQRRIDDAESKSYEATAKANLQTQSLENSVAQLDKKGTQLSGSINSLGEQREHLTESLQGLDKTRNRLINETNDLENKQKQLKSIIESENLNTVFAKLKNDLYRIHQLNALVHIRYKNGEPEHFVIPTVSWMKSDKDDLFNVVQMTRGEESPTHVHGDGTDEYLWHYQMFAVYENDILNKPVTQLNGIQKVRCSWAFSLQDESKDKIFQSVRDSINKIDEIVVDLSINNTRITSHTFKGKDFVLPADLNTLVSEGKLRLNFIQAVDAEYKDLKHAYEDSLLER